MTKNKGEIDRIIAWLRLSEEFSGLFEVSREGASEQLIDFLGTEILDTTYYVRVGQKERRRNDYLLEVVKPVLELPDRKDNADFLTRFQKWISDQSVRGLVPILGNIGRQKTWVDAQQYVEMEESSERAIYQLQLHIEYSVLETGGNK